MNKVELDHIRDRIMSVFEDEFRQRGWLPAGQVHWPSREVIAREIRRAMLDNPTDDSFNKRADERERIANYTADVILERFAAALSSPDRGSHALDKPTTD